MQHTSYGHLLILLVSAMFIVPSSSLEGEWHQDFKALRRSKRQTGPLIIDIKAVVDFYEYQQYLKIYWGSVQFAMEKIKRFYTFVFTEASDFYYKYFNMQIKLKEFWIVTRESDLSTTEYKKIDSFIDQEVLLRSFQKTTLLMREKLLEASDHVVVFTGVNLGATKDGRVYDTEGSTYRGKMCSKDGFSVSIVEDIVGKTRLSVIHNVITSIAQSLNAGVDEGDCTGGYKMGNDTHMFHLNYHSFSTCTIEDISRFIEKQLKTAEGIRCLTEKMDSRVFVDLYYNLYGHISNRNAQCKFIFGLESSFCSQATDNNCAHMNCLNPNTKTCVKVPPYSFTYCELDKACLEGRCISHLVPRQFECPRYDNYTTLGILAWGKTCHNVWTDDRKLCYNSLIRKYHCCNSCNQKNLIERGCEFGDKVDWCHKVSCDQKTYNGRNVTEACCAKCRSYRHNHFLYSSDTCLHDEMGFTINNRKCSELVKNEKGFCDSAENRQRCCSSCRKMGQLSIGCIGGSPDNCRQQASTNFALSSYTDRWLLLKMFLMLLTLEVQSFARFVSKN